MTKLYFLAADLEAARALVGTLREEGFGANEISFFADDDTPLDRMPDVPPADQSDFIPALQRGAAAGGVAGLLLGAAALSFPPAGITIGGSALLLGTGAGAGFGAWAAALVGASVPNSHLREFQESIERGKILFIVDASEDDVEPLIETVEQRHDNVSVAGTQDALPPVV